MTNDALTPCTGCQRHIRDNERACPFCGVMRAATLAGASALLIAGAFVTASCVRPPADRAQDAGTATSADAGAVAVAVADAGTTASATTPIVDAGSAVVDAGAETKRVQKKQVREQVKDIEAEKAPD